MKVVVDIITNQSSRAHKWFQESKKKTPLYADFYVWESGRNNRVEPPNNWVRDI